MSITLDGTNGITASNPATVKANAFLDAAGGNTATINGAVPAPLASPALTGTPTAPTAALGTNTTQLATTAFALLNGGLTGVKVQIFSSPGANTYTPTSGYKYALAITTDAGGRGTNAVSTGTSGAAGTTTFAIYDISAGTARTITVGTGSTTNAALSTTISGTAATSALSIAGGGSRATFTMNYNLAMGGGSFWGSYNTYGCGGDAFVSGGATSYTAGVSGVAVILEFK